MRGSQYNHRTATLYAHVIAVFSGIVALGSAVIVEDWSCSGRYIGRVRQALDGCSSGVLLNTVHDSFHELVICLIPHPLIDIVFIAIRPA